MASQRDTTGNTFGDGATIFQGDIHYYATHQLDQCLADLRLTDPRDDKTRIEQTKGGLLRDSYRWILEHESFQAWRENPQHRLLWIKGDPGKGKTMLLCGIIDEMKKLSVYCLSYFFCQATKPELRSATAVLRGLIYSLIVQQPSLISYIRDKHRHAGKQLFEDRNAWTMLSKVLIDMLSDPGLRDAVLIIDALDECTEELPRLLEFISQASSSSHAKWIVSSRNWPSIVEVLDYTGQKIRICLELNKDSISAAVQTYIQNKVQYLAQMKGYNSATRNAIEAYLIDNANDTFLWVALICENLKKVARWNAVARVQKFPSGLDSLYERMLDQVLRMEDDEDVSLCKQILAMVATLYRPITLRELCCLLGNPVHLLDDDASFEQIVQLCGSFLTIRNDIIYFIHQSAKDHLINNKIAQWTLFPSGQKKVHYDISSRSLQAMGAKLMRNIYNLRHPGPLASKIEAPDPDPLAVVRYSCVYWIDHFCEGSVDDGEVIYPADLEDDGAIFQFMQKHFLHWLEALSLIQSVSDGVLSVLRFEMLPKTLEGHSEAVISVAFSADSQRIASGSRDCTVKIWDTATGTCLQTLKGHHDSVTSIAFMLADNQHIASGSHDCTVKIWDTATGACLQTLEGLIGPVTSIAWVDGHRIASGTSADSVDIWDIAAGICLQTLEGHDNYVASIALIDGQRIATCSQDGTAKIWDMATSTCLQTLRHGHRNDFPTGPIPIAISADSKQVALDDSAGRVIEIWDIATGARLQTLKRYDSKAFSSYGLCIASVLRDFVEIWDTATGTCLQVLKGHNGNTTSIDFSANSRYIASGSWDKTIKIWDTAINTTHSHSLERFTFVSQWFDISTDGQYIVSESYGSVKIWDAATGACFQTLQHDNSDDAYLQAVQLINIDEIRPRASVSKQ
ncbi:hypothetical protein ACHAQJ_009816 [Trichoderma viride]